MNVSKPSLSPPLKYGQPPAQGPSVGPPRGQPDSGSTPETAPLSSSTRPLKRRYESKFKNNWQILRSNICFIDNAKKAPWQNVHNIESLFTLAWWHSDTWWSVVWSDWIPSLLDNTLTVWKYPMIRTIPIPVIQTNTSSIGLIFIMFSKHKYFCR